MGNAEIDFTFLSVFVINARPYPVFGREVAVLIVSRLLTTVAQISGGAPPGQPQLPGGEAAPAPPQAPSPSPPAAPPHDQSGGLWTTLIFFAVMILVFWLLIIRPQQKQRKKQEQFLAALKQGDRVITSGGLIGRIVSVAGNVVTLEVAKDTRIQVAKGHVAAYFKEEEGKSS